ncbi:hypothetical protein [Draconibacterium halophilum]|uniref:Phage-Barnase-EndoU-ColicinE5/D-RelE like nuclease 3 domain-containing protein n=1 Tax=Draconibacterium halophilum TaxID=2706887 RepID=A0A6C0REK4_9BACT|nr:hypothetical protein [Draconibacterium halophilum]QIA08820.1 hypothetical protein G0Q07_14310 [Draconibacterium halophilum]
MPLNQLKQYNQLLELAALNPAQRNKSLYGIFNRDIYNNPSFKFKGKQISPTPQDGEIKMSTLFTHLTTVIVDKATRKREFEMDRSVRLHWVKHHIDEKKKDNMLVFSVKEPEGNRTYIYDIDESYVVILEPLRKKNEYYLLTAYYVKGKDAKRNKFMKKYKRRLNEVL